VVSIGDLPPPPPCVATAPVVATKLSATAKVSSLSGKKKVPVRKETEISNVPLSIVLENVTFDLEQKTKIALVGKNGSGKSTLMKLIASYGEERVAGEVCPALESGDMYKHHNIRLAYYQQHQQDSLPYDLSPLEHFTNIAPAGSNNEQTLRAHLGSFGLCGDLALEKIGVLSGGQKARVVLAELTLFKPHILLLDEPTNNIDLEGIQAMKEAVAKYDGACVIASHDMSFLDKTVDVVYHVSKKKVVRLENGVEEYKQVVRNNVLNQRKLK
jgi:ATP-binding cassette, subfamily F, member 3